MPKEEDDASSVDMEDEPEEEEDEEAVNDLNKADIVTKYQCAGKIANDVLQLLISKVKPDAKVIDLCDVGDEMVTEMTGKVYGQKKGGKKTEKGLAFPTCVSVNNCIGHYSPLRSEGDVVMKKGDMVKIDFGVHIDGYIAVVAHTVVCGMGDEACPISGRQADAMQAAYIASECAHRMVKEGATNSEITAMIAQVAEVFKCTAVEGVLSHQMKKHVVDANKVIMNKTTSDHQVKEEKLAVNDVFGIDIVISTGEGKPKHNDTRTTVFKRDLEEKYSLKMKASRSFFSEVNQRFPTLPFTLRAGDERSWRLGVTECVKHSLFIEYPVLFEKPGEFVAQVKFTALLLPSGNVARITGSVSPPNVASNFTLEDEKLVALLAQTTDKKKKKKANKKKTADGGGD